MMITVTETEGVTNLPYYKNSRLENLSGSEEKIGVFIAKEIFAFPGGFIFRMIRPMDFEELDGLVAGFDAQTDRECGSDVLDKSSLVAARSYHAPLRGWGP